MTPTSGSLHLAWDGPCHFLDATAGVCVFHTTASWDPVTWGVSSCWREPKGSLGLPSPP